MKCAAEGCQNEASGEHRSDLGRPICCQCHDKMVREIVQNCLDVLGPNRADHLRKRLREEEWRKHGWLPW